MLVVKDLGYGMNRGLMDMERPFLGHYIPPDRQEVSNSATISEVKARFI